MTEDATLYRVPDADTLWEILAASNGTLVADTKPVTVGGRRWIRIVNGDLEARHAVPISIPNYEWTTEESTEYTVDDFGNMFDPTEGEEELNVTYLRDVRDTPFAEVDND